MSPPVPRSDHPGADLRQVVELAREREGHLLTAGERVVVDRLLALADAPLELYARLTARVGPVWRVGGLAYALDVPAAVAALEEAGLVLRCLPDDSCFPAFDLPALRAACRRLGLPVGGNRAAVEARLRGRRWVDEPVIALAHPGLIRRLELFFFQRPALDRGHLVAERLGTLRWAEYAPTGGPGLFPDRRALLTWERARAGAWSDPGEPLRLALAGRPGWGLTPWRWALNAVLAGGPDADTLGALARAGAPVAHEHALALEREGRAVEAVAACRVPPGHPERLALERTGARIARRLGLRWTPSPPLRVAPRRRVPLVPGGKATRPTWRVGERELTIEAAVAARLGELGRSALHAENWLWTSLYALAFRDLYFLPIPGMLPTPRRAGPLDLGTPWFYRHRAEAVDRRLRAIAAEGPGRWVEGWAGERLDGLVAAEAVLAWAAGVPGPMAATILGRMAREGWSAARGLPDLYLDPGLPTRWEGAIPGHLGPGALLAEVKGPTDRLRDDQRRWIDHLIEQQIPVEIWEVESTSIEYASEVNSRELASKTPD